MMFERKAVKNLKAPVEDLFWEQILKKPNINDEPPPL